jgi:6-phosphogluconate dehydrogenase
LATSIDGFITKDIKSVATEVRKRVEEFLFTRIGTSALNYFYSLVSAKLPANMIQAQRDYFGAHTFERTDELRGQFFHENWTGHGGDTKSGTYNV